MENGSSSRQRGHSSRDVPGRMGGIMHLFDFNQALAGRKLVIDKKVGDDWEAPGRPLDVHGSISEPHKLNTGKSEEYQYGYELHKPSASKKPKGKPIKALIAREMSKEPEPKHRSPGVVARLMGLDAMPADPKTLQKPPTMSVNEKSVQKLKPEKQRQEEKPQHNAKVYAKISSAPPVQVVNLPASKSYHQEGHFEPDRAGFESFPSWNHPQEEQLQEFKKKFQLRQSQNFPTSARLDDLDLQQTAKSMLVHEKLQEAGLALPRSKKLSSKQKPPPERFHESKEFLDAMDFLQSNREFFMSFLQEPSSQFEKHLQDESMPSHAVKHMPTDPYMPKTEEYRSLSWGKESQELRRSYKTGHFQMSSEADLIVEKDFMSRSRMPSFVSEDSLHSEDRQKRTSSPMISDNSRKSHVPTRIVVLKPSPARVRKPRSMSPSQPRSPKDSIEAKEVIWEDSKYVLQKLRQRLREDPREDSKYERRNSRLSINENYKDISKGPREIAREIARQVRENVTRDLMLDSGCLKGTHSNFTGTTSGRRIQSSRQASEVGDIAGTSDAECFVPTQHIYLDHCDRSSPTQNKDLDIETTHARNEGKRKSSKQFRTMSSQQSKELLSEAENAIFNRDGRFEDYQSSFSGSKSSHFLRTLGWHGVDGSNQVHKQISLHDWAHDILRNDAPCALEESPCLSNGEESNDSSPRCFVRSHSVSMMSSSVNKSQEQLQLIKGRVHSRETSKANMGKVVSTSSVDLSSAIDPTKQSFDVSTQSVFREKDPGLEGSFPLIRKQDDNKEWTDHISISRKDSAAQESTEDASATSLKDQCQIEDLGPVADDDSTVSSLENCVSLEAPLAEEDSLCAEGLRVHQLGMGSGGTCSINSMEQEGHDNEVECEQWSTEILASKTDFDSSLRSLSASPKKLLCLESDAPPSTTTELTKEQSEQPSPVSVLDVSFQEESTGVMDFKEISSGLQDLRMRLRLLKFDDSEPDTMEGLVTDEYRENEIYPPFPDFDSMVDSEFPLKDATFFDTDEMDCPSGKEPEMDYVKEILVASGFTSGSTIILTRWYAPTQPLDPCLFRNMECSYSREESEIQESQKSSNGTLKQGGGLLDSQKRHLLFDRVNEVLLEVLGPYLNRHVWLSPLKLAESPMPSGKDLVNLVWKEVCLLSCSHTKAQDTLENLVTKDLAKGDGMIEHKVDTETVGLEVERAIFNDLIEETMLDL